MRIVVTGGTGFFGQAFIDHLLREPAVERIVVLSRDEYKQAVMAERLGDRAPLRFFLGDVRDVDRLAQAFWGCDTVVHAAALKRVDAVAYNPWEVRRTNIEGSANVVSAAIAAGVQRVVMISSDKAVQPTNAYGVSKAQMEHESIAANAYGAPRGTRISCVRYGNVLGSRGSVLATWKRQADAGEPLTLTDPKMTRFWLTITQAIALVTTALATMRGGEVFVPNLPAVTMTDVAEAVAPGHEIKITGLRPGGEKLHEQLLSEEEVARTLAIDGHYIVTPSHRSWSSDAWDGEPVNPEMLYRSDVRRWRLSVPEIATMIEAAA